MIYFQSSMWNNFCIQILKLFKYLFIIQILILFKYLFYSNTYLLFKYLFYSNTNFIQILFLLKYLFYLLFKYLCYIVVGTWIHVWIVDESVRKVRKPVLFLTNFLKFAPHVILYHFWGRISNFSNTPSSIEYTILFPSPIKRKLIYYNTNL